MAWDFSTDPEYSRTLEWVRQFVDEYVTPLELLDKPYREMQPAIRVLQREVKERGLWAAHLGPDLGGAGFGQVKLTLLHEILGRTLYAPLVFGNNAPDSGNTELLALAAEQTGNSDLVRDWLQPLLNGEVQSAFSMTEPGAGADPTMLSTTAVKDGDSWLISGEKWFTTNASLADFIIVMAVTDPDAPPRNRASLFIVPAGTAGLEVVCDIPSMEDPAERSGHFWSHSLVRYTDVRVPASNMVGRRGDGFVLAQQRLGPGRLHHSMRWLGQAKRALEMLCERAMSRTVFGSLLADKQTAQNWIADSRAELAAARLMTLHAAWTVDQFGSKAAQDEIAMIKYFGPQVLHNIIDRAIQAHGSLGYSSFMPLESMYRAARSARIYDGPDEVHRVTVARHTLRDFTLHVTPSEYVPPRREAAERYFDSLLTQASVP
ncbi:acyl-CoA dehydrogenase family protein [Mycolicibacterium sp.]|uniref:acyl-CoA dehydrogenase family protein n=1 Tax=Mycolicibacterium sp. TaxID=2320850 RepID=UPI0037C67DAF